MPKGILSVLLSVTLTQREQLQTWLKRAKTVPALALRAKIVLLAADGLHNPEIALRLGCSSPTVRLWRCRFTECGVEGLLDERWGRPRSMSDKQVENAQRYLSASQINTSKLCSTRTMAKACGTSQSTPGSILRTFALAPQRSEIFTLLPPLLDMRNAHEVCGLYLAPPDRAFALRVHPKEQNQEPTSTASKRQQLYPVNWRTDKERVDEIAQLLAALEFKAIRITAQGPRWQRSSEFRNFLTTVDKTVLPEWDIHLIVNCGSHKTEFIKTWLAKRPRFISILPLHRSYGLT